MSASILLIAVIVFFFVLLTIAVLEMERSYKANILGGLIIMWTVIILFLVAAYFLGPDQKAAPPAQADQTSIR